jgi:Domain of unknown function (DUF1823)
VKTFEAMTDLTTDLPPALPPLTDATLWAILDDSLEDAIANRLVWQCLGYRLQAGQWDTTAVSPNWRDPYPEPPDFIASRPATVKLTRSIPKEYKQLLKEELGFAGYSVSELVPRKTRRATMVNWLLAYRRSSPI